jgi:hypothetical protein
MHKHLFLVLLLAGFLTSNGQYLSFDIKIEKFIDLDMNGIQSYAIGTHQGKWLIIGGRTDGLHRRQPFASFDEEGNNKEVFLINPQDSSVVSVSINQFPENLREQLQSANMQFYQKGNWLYLIGGYGYSATLDEHTTFSKLIVLHVPKVMEAIENKSDLASYVYYFEHPYFQVTGARLESIYDDLYLVGGHKFLGRYNPLDPDHGPGYVQEYSNRIFIFNISFWGDKLEMDSISTIEDSLWLHRRDYNVTAQILPDGTEGLTAFSGVFQKERDLPFLHSVTISQDGMFPNDSFFQHYNHYHCAHVGFVSNSLNQMHTLFFGGIAQFFDSAGILVQDNNVPFVKTVARVTREPNGEMFEYKLPVEMPDFLGTGSEFIIHPNISVRHNGVVNLDSLTLDSMVTLGYILGGIKSTAPNIFWDNEGDLSSASNVVYRVSILPHNNKTNHKLNARSNSPIKVALYPDFYSGDFDFEYVLPSKHKSLSWAVYSLDGKKLFSQKNIVSNAGNNLVNSNIPELKNLGTFKFEMLVGKTKYTQLFKVE